MLAQAANMVIISNSDNMTSNFVLPAEVGNATATWESDKPEYISIADEVILTNDQFLVYPATVKRPSETVGNVTVTLTGTFAYGDETYEKQYIIRVSAEFGLTTYDNLTELHTNAAIDDFVTAAGFVYSKYAYGYFITDASGAYLNVYTTPENVALVNIGDEVRVKGTYYYYHNLFQVKDLTEQVVLNSNNVLDIEKIVLNDATDLMLIDTTNRLLNGQIYTITVTPQLLMQGSFQNIYLFDGATRVATVYYNSLSDSEVALSQYVGQKVTIDVLYYTYYESGSSILDPSVPEFWVTFDGTDQDIVAQTLTDAEKLAMDIGKLPSSLEVTGSLLLPALTYGTYTYIIISPELTDYLSYASGAFTVTRPETDTTGTITVAISYNDESDSAIIDVLMKAPVIVVPGDDLFISQYIEGTSFNKYIEIYNPLDHAVNLGEYTLELYSNGAVSASTTMTLSGTLNPGDVVVVSRSDATIYTAIDIYNSTVINFNGDDAVVLKHNGSVVDSIGKIGERPSSGYWGDTTVATANMTLVRKASITGGDTDPYDTYDPTTQWDAYPIDSPTDLGTHTMN